MSHTDIIERWLDTLEGKTDSRGRRLRNFRGANVYAEGDTLYSYGRHFPLAEYHRPNRARRRPLFLLNGDTFSVSTSRHQADARGAIGRAVSPNGLRQLDADMLIIPFSALTAAGIARGTIAPLDVRPDEWLTVADIPCPADVDNPETATETVLSTVAAYGPAGREDRPVKVHRWRTAGYLFERTEYLPHGESAGGLADYVNVREWPAGEPRQLTGPPGARRLVTRRHRLGDSLFLATVPGARTVRRPVTAADVVRAAVRSIESRRRGFDSLDVVATLDNVDVDAPIVETVDTRPRRRFVSSFDINEPAPLYFLATLPHASNARTVASALDDLAPPAVHAAYARGLHVERQGDIFAIETRLTDDDLAGYPRARLTMWTRSARPRHPSEPGYVAPLTADERRAIVKHARRLWRQTWNAQPQPRPLPLPRNGRRKLAEARATHERELAAARDRARRAVLRGAIYPSQSAREGIRAQLLRGPRLHPSGKPAIRAILRDDYRHAGTSAQEHWRACLQTAHERLRPNANPDRARAAAERTREILSIHRTAHTATEVVSASGGRTYIRGAMVHAPGLEPGARFGRRRDHVKRPLRPGVWYLAVRNTVPRASADTNGRR